MSSSHLSYYGEYPHVLCFIVSAVMLLASLWNLHSAGLSEDYLPLTGEISNVEEDSKLVHGTRRTYYDFDVSWEMDGQMYKKHFDDQVDYRSEGAVDIWVSPDGQKVRFSSSEEVYKETPVSIAIGIIAGILGFVLLKRKNKKRKYISKAERMDQLENLQIGSAIGFFCFLTGAGFVGYDMYKEYRDAMEFNPLTVDLMIVVGVGILICVGVFIYATKKRR